MKRTGPEFRRALAREHLIEDFLSDVEAVMRAQRMTRAELARRMGCSRANVSSLFRRTANLTAATMADIAFHLGLQLQLRLEPAAGAGAKGQA